jgi:antitoxin component of MazEF toxin-antitoxin module
MSGLRCGEDPPVVNGCRLAMTKREYMLSELLEKIKPANIHGETDWGQAVGREAW